MMTGTRRASIYTAQSLLDIEEAVKKGFECLDRKPWQLFIDLDDGDMTAFVRRLVAQYEGCVKNWRWWKSKSGKGRHVVVELVPRGKPPEPKEVVRMQRELGSDPKREKAALKDIAVGNPFYSILFRPAKAKVHIMGSL